MNGPEHYAEAERMIEGAYAARTERLHAARVRIAQVHATLALVAATVEAADQATGNGTYARPLIRRPHKGDDVDPPMPGSPWGNALYGTGGTA